MNYLCRIYAELFTYYVEMDRNISECTKYYEEDNRTVGLIE